MTSLFPDSNDNSFNTRLWYTMVALMVVTVIMVIVAIVTLMTSNTDSEKILTKIEAQVQESRVSGKARACSNFQNQRAIEQAIRIATGAPLDPPLVLPSRSIVDACRSAGVAFDKQGIPVLQQPLFNQKD